MDDTDTEIVIDIQLTRDLLDLLREKDVHSFQGFGMTVVFNEKPETYSPPGHTVEAAKIEDDGHSTSTKRVGGFRDPSLFPWQNGKSLTFKGTLE